MCNKGCYTGNSRGHKVYCYTKDEQQEVFVIAISEAVINKGAVMIEFLHTELAIDAMKSSV
jgi:hypothetical protein